MSTPIVRRRKKPVEVDTIQWTGSNEAEVIAFTGGNFLLPERVERIFSPEYTAKVYDSLHDTWVRMKTGQHVVRGVQGEFYPIAEDVLADTYDTVDETFFQPGHTYEYAPLHLLFRCDAVNAHPVTGEPSAVGWVRYHGGGWSAGDYSPAEYADEWADVTEAGDGRG